MSDYHAFMAIEIIAELEYAQASLGHIVKHAYMSKGVISYRFSSKEELLEQIVKEYYIACSVAKAAFCAFPLKRHGSGSSSLCLFPDTA